MSGYGKLQARKIIAAGLTGYENMKATARRRGVEIHQSAAQGAIQRRRARLVGKSSWFKGPPKQRTTTTTTTTTATRRRRPAAAQKQQMRKTPVAVLFCPQSCHGALAQRLKEQEVLLSKLTGETVKVQEVSGTTISQMLTRSNPFKTKCDEPCVLCESTGGRQDCTRRGILYSLECT